ncbi:hypothetical protein QTI27_35200 [Variovorax sp. J31P216]|nr:hypothetical protein [Variovorax sp. J31P216]
MPPRNILSEPNLQNEHPIKAESDFGVLAPQFRDDAVDIELIAKKQEHNFPTVEQQIPSLGNRLRSTLSASSGGHINSFSIVRHPGDSGAEMLSARALSEPKRKFPLLLQPVGDSAPEEPNSLPLNFDGTFDNTPRPDNTPRFAKPIVDSGSDAHLIEATEGTKKHCWTASSPQSEDLHLRALVGLLS